MKKTPLMKLAAKYTRGTWGAMVFALAATAVSIVLSFLTPKIISFAVDSVIGTQEMQLPAWLLDIITELGGRDVLRENLFLFAVGIVLVALLGALVSYWSKYYISKGTETFIRNLRNDLIDHIMHLPFKWHNENQTGGTIQRCTSDVETIRAFIADQLIEVLRTVMLLSIALSLMFPMNAKLTWIFLASVPVIILYSAIFQGRIGRQFRAADETEGELMTLVQENLTGVRVVRAFGREKFERERFTKMNNRFAKEWIDMGYTMGFFWGIGDFVSVMQVLLIICMGAVFASRGELTLGNFMVFVSYTQTLSWPIRDFGHVISEMSKAGVSIDRVREILDAPLEQDSPDASDQFPDGDIVFDHVSFAYGENKTLHDVSFTVKRGSTVGILGSTGSGKSTITYLLNRLYELPEDSGSITIGGRDVRGIKLDTLRRGIGLVLQEPFLFSKTIRDNLKIAAPEVSDETMKRSTQIAAVDEDISAFPKGYDTMVGERGVTLSGGQKQRVAMARTLLMNCPVVVFDDSMSAVDMETDAQIREALRENTGDTTVIMISHRINTLMLADNIIVVDNGRIAESGTHAELLKNNGLYRRVYDLQSGAADQPEGGAANE